MMLVSLRGYSAIVFGLGTVLVAGHVLSTAIGSRLRAGTDAYCNWEREQSGIKQQTARSPDNRSDLTRPSQLQVRTACSRLLWGAVLLAMCSGGLAGILGLNLIAGPSIGWPGQLIGAFSAAMISGWVALIVAGICGIARRTWHQVEPDATK